MAENCIGYARMLLDIYRMTKIEERIKEKTFLLLASCLRAKEIEEQINLKPNIYHINKSTSVQSRLDSLMSFIPFHLIAYVSLAATLCRKIIHRRLFIVYPIV